MNSYLIHRLDRNLSINKRKVDEPQCAKEKQTLRKRAKAHTHFVSTAKEARDKRAEAFEMKGRSGLIENEHRWEQNITKWTKWS